MTSNTTEALGHVTSADVQQPRTIYVQFSEIGTIRKWAWEPFDKAEPLIAENGWVSGTPTLCATGDDGELADLFWRIKEKMPVHHEELLDLADRITALSAEVERKDALIEKLQGAISWIEPPFVNENTPEAELRSRIGFCVADAKRAALGAKP